MKLAGTATRAGWVVFGWGEILGQWEMAGVLSLELPAEMGQQQRLSLGLGQGSLDRYGESSDQPDACVCWGNRRVMTARLVKIVSIIG